MTHPFDEDAYSERAMHLWDEERHLGIHRGRRLPQRTYTPAPQPTPVTRSPAPKTGEPAFGLGGIFAALFLLGLLVAVLGCDPEGRPERPAWCPSEHEEVLCEVLSCMEDADIDEPDYETFGFGIVVGVAQGCYHGLGCPVDAQDDLIDTAIQAYTQGLRCW